jgi:serine/threonine protein kinase
MQTAVREIKLLALLRHENIVRLEHIVTPPKADREAGDTIYMVFEYLFRSSGDLHLSSHLSRPLSDQRG